MPAAIHLTPPVATSLSDPLLGLLFALAAVVSLASSWLLVTRLERVGAALGMSEGLLGMLAALAADAPEITAAVTAVAGHHSRVGAGVVMGSNAFNLAALLGLAAVLATGITLHRRVVLFSGAVAVWIAITCLVVVTGALPAAAGLALALAALVPYLVLLGLRSEALTRTPLPRSWTEWLAAAVREEEEELEPAIHPSRGHARDVAGAVLATAVVVGASVAMEHAASELGSRHGVPDIVVGGLVLAAVTSLPNAVAAVYLARRNRGSAVLSTALNSNALNVVGGLLLPAVIAGLGAPSGPANFLAACYLGMTALALVLAYAGRGLGRGAGALIIGVYLAVVGVLLAIT